MEPKQPKIKGKIQAHRKIVSEQTLITNSCHLCGEAGHHKRGSIHYFSEEKTGQNKTQQQNGAKFKSNEGKGNIGNKNIQGRLSRGMASDLSELKKRKPNTARRVKKKAGNKKRVEPGMSSLFRYRLAAKLAKKPARQEEKKSPARLAGGVMRCGLESFAILKEEAKKNNNTQEKPQEIRRKKGETGVL